MSAPLPCTNQPVSPVHHLCVLCCQEQLNMIEEQLQKRKRGQGVIFHGAGGTGKTCLMGCYALQIMRKEPDAVVFLHFTGLR